MSKQLLTRQRVLELIDQLQVGEAIPPERRLSSDLGISRLTLRAALDDLVRDGDEVECHTARHQNRGQHVAQTCCGKIDDRERLFEVSIPRQCLAPYFQIRRKRFTPVGSASTSIRIGAGCRARAKSVSSAGVR